MQTILSPTLDLAAGDFAVGDAAEVIAVIEVGDEHLEMLVGVGGGGGMFFDDRLVRAAPCRRCSSSWPFHSHDGEAELGRGVDDGEIELLVGGVKFEEKLEDHVEHLVRAGVFAVDLVDDDDGLGADFERLAQHELGLGLRAVEGVDDEQHAVDHLQDALHFAAEIGVAGGVDDVDVVILVLERGVLGLDRDALFALEVHRVHDALDDGLVGAERCPTGAGADPRAWSCRGRRGR
jgi:hypothetical protein